MNGASAMLRQLVGQIQELWELYGSAEVRQQFHRSFNLDESIMDYSYYTSVLPREKAGISMTEGLAMPPAKRSQRGKAKRKPTDISTEMEQDVWKEFPEDLFEAVIARLPVATFFRFRSVCRKWNALLVSESFFQVRSEIPQSCPWFYTITHEHINSGAMYDPALKKWYHLTISSLPSKIITLPVTSAGGLVCFLDVSHRNFFVCNPLTRSFRELPARSVRVWSRVAVGMTRDCQSSSGGYKIMWLGCDGEHEVYDSRQNSWVRPGAIPAHVDLPLFLNFKSQVVSIGQTLYFMRSDPDGIVSYNVGTGIWRQFAVPSPPYLTDYALAESRGRIMLVGLLTKNAATCVCVWELQKMTLLWKEVDRMPNVWCLEFYGKHVRMTCLGNRGLLMLSLRSRQMNRLVTYDVLQREWRRVPGCMLPRCRRRQWIACGTAFNPCPVSVA